LGSNSKAGEPYVTRVIDEHIRRLYVLMDEALSMSLADGLR
jgi:hypothetical protein